MFIRYSVFHIFNFYQMLPLYLRFLLLDQ